MKFLVIGGIFACFLIIGSTAQKNVGPGTWSVINVMKCDKDNIYPIKVDVNRRKVNRTHDGFNCNVTLEEPLDDTYAIRIDICKVVTGGCKDYNTMGDDSMIKFINKFAEENAKSALRSAGLKEEFPVDAGFHSFQNYMFDYSELPPEAPYGEFMGLAYLIKNAQEQACVKVHALFEEDE